MRFRNPLSSAHPWIVINEIDGFQNTHIITVTLQGFTDSAVEVIRGFRLIVPLFGDQTQRSARAEIVEFHQARLEKHSTRTRRLSSNVLSALTLVVSLTNFLCINASNL